MSSGKPFHYLGFIEVGDGDAENFQGVLGTMYGAVLDLNNVWCRATEDGVISKN